MNPLLPYRRALMALLGAVLLSLHGFYSDDVLTGGETMQALFAGLGAFGVYALPDAPGYRFVKPIVMAVAGALNILIAATNAGEPYSTELWLNVGITVLTVLGIITVQNDPEPAVPPTANTVSSSQAGFPKAA